MASQPANPQVPQSPLERLWVLFDVLHAGDSTGESTVNEALAEARRRDWKELRSLLAQELGTARVHLSREEAADMLEAVGMAGSLREGMVSGANLRRLYDKLSVLSAGGEVAGDGVPAGWFRAGDKLTPSDATAEEAVRVLLLSVGEDPGRDGLRDTPRRVVKALREMTEGLTQDPGELLKVQFDVGHDEMVLLRGVSFTSLCEHHLLPFTGTASLAYIPRPPIQPNAPGGKVVGLSKLARLVQVYARRPQVQERMTGQIADALVKHLNTVGAACVVEAEHSCLACRGARLPGAVFVTSALRGAFKDDARARAEVLSLIGKKP